MIFKSKSIESFVIQVLLGAGLLIASLIFVVLWQMGFSFWHLVIIELFVVLIAAWAISYFRKKLLVAFKRALLHIEAIKSEDYNQHAKSDFEDGTSWQLHTALKDLSGHLQKNKSRYDQHAFLLYQLIDQLNTPIMVFNKKHKLTYANAAFTTIYEQPWQMYRLASPSLLGLEKTKSGWQLPRTGQQWQVSESEFIDEAEAHYLLVCTNIDSAVRASQLNAWQQIIRVMGHEIRNSLTPVSSLAESLSSKMSEPREQQALQLISERCHHLQDFINRYASLSQKLNLHKSAINFETLCLRLKELNPELDISSQVGVKTIHADESFIEQVFINLLKNAKEAEADRVKIRIRNKANRVVITLSDNGHGFLNTENLFVPLFTTKTDGQGIGLSFCRNIIEQHQGTIHLANNEDRGVTVTMSLPVL